MQRNIIALGDPVVAQSIQDILRSLSAPGILDGMELIAASSNTIGISPGSALTDSGVLIIEDELKTYPITLTINPINYTVYYSYTPSTNFGGNPAVLTVQTGLIAPENFSNGVLLGWLQYSGSSQPLNASMFISAPRLQLSVPEAKLKNNYTMIYAPFTQKWGLATVSGPALSVSEIYDVSTHTLMTTLTNAGGAVSNSIYLIPFKVPYTNLGKVLIELSAQAGANVTVSILKRDGTEINPQNTNFFTNLAMSKQVLSIPNLLTPNEDVCLKLKVDVQPTFGVTIKSIGFSSYTEPF